jgi:peptidoglycan/LPS O-acetylase OafA/YrhL
MEGLRGAAILLVFLCHYYDIIWRDLPQPEQRFTQLGYILMGAGGTGVDLFFVLSGFLIYGAVRRPRLRFQKFWMRRIQRIYPAFLAVFIIYLAMSPLLGHAGPASRYSNRIPATLAGGVLYVLANGLFIPGVFPIQPLMNVAWSLSYEWMFYLCLPFLVAATRLYGWSRRARVAAFSAAALMFLTCNVLFPATFYFPSNASNASHIRAIMFIGGILVFELTEWNSQQAGSPPALSLPAVVLALVGAGASALVTLGRIHATAGFDPNVPRVEAWVSGFLFLGYSSLVFGTLARSTFLRRLFGVDWIRWLGNMSYSFYLIHGIPLHAFGLIAARLQLTSLPVPVVWLVFMAGLPATFLATSAVSAALFLAVEKRWSLGKTGRVPVHEGRVPQTALTVRN